MKIYDNLWKSIKIYENLWKSMKIYENLWKSMQIYENLWKSMKIYGNLWKSKDICVLKKEDDYILYSKHINVSHICPSKRNRFFKQRKWKSWFSGKHGLWPANYISKALFLWKPEMIPRSLRSFCPSRFDWKPQ